jgi:hypothetical protein
MDFEENTPELFQILYESEQHLMGFEKDLKSLPKQASQKEEPAQQQLKFSSETFETLKLSLKRMLPSDIQADFHVDDLTQFPLFTTS